MEEFNTLGDAFDYSRHVDLETLKSKVSSKLKIENLATELTRDKQTLQDLISIFQNKTYTLNILV